MPRLAVAEVVRGHARSERGHFEMDTVVSSAKGRGGTLCLYDRATRLCRTSPT